MSASISLRCSICSSDCFRKIFAKGEQDFIKCMGCGLIRLHSIPVLDELLRYYDQILETEVGAAFVAEEEMLRATARCHVETVHRYSAGKRWLDIGCGTGLMLEEASKAGFIVEGIDISQGGIEKARERELRVYRSTPEAFFPDTPYDIVTAFDVIEHVLDPVSFLESVNRLLRTEGIFVLTTPDTNSLFCRLMGKRWYFYIPEQHLFYFNRHNLTTLLTRLRFRVLDTFRAYKALNYEYSHVQFQNYNPLICRLWEGLGVTLPSSWRRRSFNLYIGEMTVISQKVS